jgi:hypothetical protein
VGVTADGIPFPEYTDAPDGPKQIAALSNWLDAFFVAGPAAWPTWSPTVSQGSGVTVTNTYSHYLKWGRLFLATFALTAGSSGTSGGNIVITLPEAAANTEAIRGGIQVLDLSASQNHVGMIAGVSTSTVVGVYGAGGGGNIGTNPAFALASGDILRGWVFMETAA